MSKKNKNGIQESKEEKRNANRLTDNALQEEIDQVNIIPSIKSDHSAILLSINGIEEQTHGPSFWKFNTSLLDGKDYVALINGRYEVWIEEFKDIQDPGGGGGTPLQEANGDVPLDGVAFSRLE